MPHQSEFALGTRENPFTHDNTIDDSIITSSQWARCSDCFSRQHWSELEIWQCSDCRNPCCDGCGESPCECYESMPDRLYSPLDLPEFQSDDNGKIITSQRKFSAEIECYVEGYEQAHTVARQLNHHVGVTEDGSLGNNGMELQTPKLRGKKGEQAIKDICRILSNNDATVDKDCGLHIHLDGSGLIPRTLTTTHPLALIQLWQFYVVFDEVMLSFLPRSRRTNTFCRPMKETAKYAHISNCKTQRDIEILWYQTNNLVHINENKAHAKHGSRYHGINLHILLAEKHLEVRFHSGTVNATKMLEWTSLHQRICDMAASNMLITSENMLVLDLAQKTKMFFAILGLPDRAVKYFTRRQTLFAPKMEEIKKTYQNFRNQDVSVLHDVDTNDTDEEEVEANEASESNGFEILSI